MDKRIAIFHREECIRKLYKSILEKAGYIINAYNVSKATATCEVLEKVVNDDPLMVFLAVNYGSRLEILEDNINFPEDRKGIQTLEMLKNNQITKNIPVIMVSASDSYAEECTRKGANWYIHIDPMKFDAAELVGVAKRLDLTEKLDKPGEISDKYIIKIVVDSPSSIHIFSKKIGNS